MGALSTVVVPWFADRYDEGVDWRAMAWWIHDHLPYSELQFFPKLSAFNIGWHDRPKRRIDSFIPPRGQSTAVRRFRRRLQSVGCVGLSPLPNSKLDASGAVTDRWFA